MPSLCAAPRCVVLLIAAHASAVGSQATEGVCLLQRGKPAAAIAGKRAKFSEQLPVEQSLATLVINLDARPDRWTRMVQRLRALNQSGLLNAQRFRATDAKEVDLIATADVRETWRTDRNADYVGLFYVRKKLNLSSSERACAHSHVRVWQEIAKQEVEKPTLVLEDDALLSADFATRLRDLLRQFESVRAVGPDMLYIGYSEAEPLVNKVGKGVYQAPYLWSTIGYLLWPKAARTLLAARPVDQPVDNFIAWQIKRGRMLALAAKPKLVEPEHVWDVMSNVEHSDEDDMFLIDRFKMLFEAPIAALRSLFS